MNIQQFIDKPESISTLTQEQKMVLYQSLKSRSEQLTQEKVKLETEKTIKQQEQQDLFIKLQELTGKKTLEEIKRSIDDLKTRLDTELQGISQQFQGLQ